MARLSTQLRYWRENRGLSQQQVVNALDQEGMGRERATLSQYESGVRTPPIEVIKALARIYRCKVDDLVTDSPESLVDLPSDPATKSDVDRILAAISEVRTLVLARSGT